MANSEHLARLQQGIENWNKWRKENPDIEPDLSGADLSRAVLGQANLDRAHLILANLHQANLYQANLHRANLHQANLYAAHLGKADLTEANLAKTNLRLADLRGANLAKANLRLADVNEADLTRTNLHQANLYRARLDWADLTEANLIEANLDEAILINTRLSKANLTDCSIYGISVWNANLEGAIQSNLRITPYYEPSIQVDNLEVAQFIYLLMNNEKIRHIIDTIGKKGVLLLGRFAGDRMAILEKLRNELRNRGFVPIVFNFDKPEIKDFTETLRLLAGLSHFVIADITNPRSAPLELQAVMPEYRVPFVPILDRREEPFTMFRDLWIKHREWVLDPICYSSADRLIEVLDSAVIKPAEARFNILLARKAEELRIKDV